MSCGSLLRKLGCNGTPAVQACAGSLGPLTFAREQAETPANLLRVDGRAARLVRSQQCYLAAEAREGLFPWNGAEDNLIDRFDGRALLDFYREPDPRSQRPKTEDELELEAVRPC